MGLKSKLSKMKNFLFDEEEIEKPEKKKIKSKNDETDFVVERTKEKIDKYEEDDFLFDDVSDNEMIEKNIEVKSRVTKENEKEFKFPEFNDEDFMASVREEPRFEPVKKPEAKPVLYQGSKRREETKKFKPSPIISPIFGLLDNKGNTLKADETKKNDIPLKSKDEKNYDIIRKKAYGSLDEEFENTISRLSKKTIEEAESDMEEEEKKNQKVYFENSKVKVDKNLSKNNIDDDNDMVLPTVNFKEIDILESCKVKVTKEVSLEDEEDEDTKEQDLFNLIDTIYSGGEK